MQTVQRRATVFTLAVALLASGLAVPTGASGFRDREAVAAGRIDPERETSPPATAATSKMIQKDAKFYIGRHLRDAYGKKWKFGNKKKFKKCKNINRTRMRCKVSWYFDDKYYFHGSGTAWYPLKKGVVRTRIDIDGERI